VGTATCDLREPELAGGTGSLALRTSESAGYTPANRKFPYAGGQAGEANELSSRLLGVAVAVFEHAMRSQSAR